MHDKNELNMQDIGYIFTFNTSEQINNKVIEMSEKGMQLTKIHNEGNTHYAVFEEIA